MDKFKLTSEYKPTGDQPVAIKQLVEGFEPLSRYLGHLRSRVLRSGKCRGGSVGHHRDGTPEIHWPECTDQLVQSAPSSQNPTRRPS